MENFVPIPAAALVLFVAMILNLAVKTKSSGKLNGLLMLVMGAGALVIYGCGYAHNENTFVQAVLRTLLAVFGIYMGKTDEEAVAGTWFATNEGMIVFWIVHLIALYATASTVITALGSQVLQRLRLMIARWGELNLIYGVNSDSVELGKSLMESRKCSVVYIDSKADATLTAAISKYRCVLRGDENAVNGDAAFLRSVAIRRGKRKITLFALNKDPSENIRYARDFLASLKAAGVRPEQTTLVMLGREDSGAGELQAMGDNYGYGYVTVVNEAGLVARLLIMNTPPCECIAFDADAKAQEDFEVLQVGFGQLGQAVLKQLVMHGQFEGSVFRAAIFAPDCESQIGYFDNSCPQVLERYDIAFHPYDARSRKMYEHLWQRLDKIKYVVICTGSEKINWEVGEALSAFFAQHEIDIPVHMCSYAGIISLKSGRINRHKIYQADVLSNADVDQMAMLLNHYYCNDESKTPLQHWMECNYFNRMSSRAFADFIGAYVHMVGKPPEEVMTGGWNLTQKQILNLSMTEHLRWCAFHYCMGFSPMSEEEFDARAAEYKKQMERDGKASIRIAKNMQKRTHACLIDWDALDVLSEKENEITGKQVDYRALDTENVLAIPALLKLGEKTK